MGKCIIKNKFQTNFFKFFLMNIILLNAHYILFFYIYLLKKQQLNNHKSDGNHDIIKYKYLLTKCYKLTTPKYIFEHLLLQFAIFSL